MKGQTNVYDEFLFSKVYDGPNIGSPGMGAVTNDTTPVFTSSGQNIAIRFYTDYQLQAKGFKLEYKLGR